MYDLIFRTVFARMDPERAHNLAYRAIRALPALGGAVWARPVTAASTSLRVQTMGLTFPSPFGIAAGFDKHGAAILGLGQLGFGHVEMGTVTALPQPGNERPRLFRLIEDRAVINRMGFNNHGAKAAQAQLARVRRRQRRPIIGVNIGKSRVVSIEDAVADYVTSTRLLAPHADYLVVNVSSPNTPGLRSLQSVEQLTPLLTAVRSEAGGKPLLVKIAPDLTDEEIVEITELAVTLGLAGVIATNTTLSREGLRSTPERVAAAGAGGLSGAPLAERSLAVLQLIRSVAPDDFCVISVGGVTSAADVAARLQHGATLVQGYTAFLYEGPLWARSINRGLERLLRERQSGR